MTNEMFDRLMVYLEWDADSATVSALRLVAVNQLTQSDACKALGIHQGTITAKIKAFRAHVAKLEALTGIDFELTIKDGRKK